MKEHKMEVYPQHALILQKVSNGFRVTVKGTVQNQEDDMNGEYVFEKKENLLGWVEEYFDKLVNS